MDDERRGPHASNPPQSPPTVDERIIALETRIAYQDHLLASLDEVIRDFTTRVERLERSVREVRSALAGMSDPGPANQPPPHY